MLVLAQLCADEGLFEAAGAWLARADGPRRLLVLVFGVASVTTAVLSLDATVVLLTPVVFATASRLGVRARPHVYACTHLANSASLLLPVSNLTNLLAFAAAGVSFTRFTALMAGPWLVVVVVEYLVFRRFFRRDLAAVARSPAGPARPVPVFPLVVLALTLAGFVGGSLAGVDPVWAAVAGRGGARGPRARVAPAPRRPGSRARSASRSSRSCSRWAWWCGRWWTTGSTARSATCCRPGRACSRCSRSPGWRRCWPTWSTTCRRCWSCCRWPRRPGSGAVLALLIGVNLGPNLTYVGSLATLLWRRVLRDHDSRVELAEFTRLGLLTVPVSLILAVLALWAGLHVIGG